MSRTSSRSRSAWNPSRSAGYLRHPTGYILGNLFFEPSTRTRMSFASAFMRLGGQVNGSVGFEATSIAPRGTLRDTIRADAGILRHHRHAASPSQREAAQLARVPVLNGGEKEPTPQRCRVQGSTATVGWLVLTRRAALLQDELPTAACDVRVPSGKNLSTCLTVDRHDTQAWMSSRSKGRRSGETDVLYMTRQPQNGRSCSPLEVTGYTHFSSQSPGRWMGTKNAALSASRDGLPQSPLPPNSRWEG